MEQKYNLRRRVYPLMRPYLGSMVVLNLLTLVQAAAQIAVAVVTKFVIDAALSGSHHFTAWAIGLCGLLLGMVALHSLSGWLVGSTTDRCVADLRQALLAAAQRSSGETLQQYHSGALLSRGMEDVHILCDGMVTALPSLVGQLARFLGAFAAIVVLYPSIAPLLFLASVVVIGGTAALRSVMRRLHRQVRQADEQVMGCMQENLQQLELVQSLQMEQTSQSRFARFISASLSMRRRRRIWSVSINTVLSLASQLGTGVLLLWCAVQVAENAISYGGLSAMLQLLSMLRSPVVGLSGMWNRLSAVRVSAERLCGLLDTPDTPPVPRDVPAVKALVFQDVTFCYPGDDAPVLAHFSLQLPLAGWTALTGISGKGKSTMFKLILGLYTPQAGQVLLETDRGLIPCGPDTRHLFAYVPQDYCLFSGTVRENLLLAAPKATQAQMDAALRAAQADFVFDLAAGLDAPLRENNTGLSKGQLQRIAIARAILMDRPVLLLDECSSALDAQTECALWDALSNTHKTAIVVTHRPEALEGRPAVTFLPMDT